MSAPLRIVLADDAAEMRALLRWRCCARPEAAIEEVAVVGEAANGHEALAMVAELTPTSSCSTSRCRGRRPGELLTAMAAVAAGIPIVTFSGFEPDLIAPVESRLVALHIPKTTDLALVRAAIVDVARGAGGAEQHLTAPQPPAILGDIVARGGQDGTQPARVVVVDDDERLRSELRAALQEAGLTVIAEADNGRDAIDLAAHFRPDVMIMDIVMANIDGLSATREIVARAPSVRILLLTASDDVELGMVGLRAGPPAIRSRASRSPRSSTRLRGWRRGSLLPALS